MRKIRIQTWSLSNYLHVTRYFRHLLTRQRLLKEKPHIDSGVASLYHDAGDAGCCWYGAVWGRRNSPLTEPTPEPFAKLLIHPFNTAL
jgi:hypothetical protein